MKIGTKSLLFGAHQFLIHPLFVALAWWRLYGFPWDPRLWVAFFVYDLGYWGKANMDGPEGEQHPLFGARLMGCWFDRCHPDSHLYIPYLVDPEQDTFWYNFTLCHSRYFAKAHRRPYSRLCVADKLAVAITPTWLYLPLVRLTGEIVEYMKLADQRREAGEVSLHNRPMANCTPREWYRRMVNHCHLWALTHADGRHDTWTPSPWRLKEPTSEL